MDDLGLDHIRVRLSFPNGDVSHFEFDMSGPESLRQAISGLTLALASLKPGDHLIYVNETLFEKWLKTDISPGLWDVLILRMN